jgi:hypothetical protein
MNCHRPKFDVLHERYQCRQTRAARVRASRMETKAGVCFPSHMAEYDASTEKISLGERTDDLQRLISDCESSRGPRVIACVTVHLVLDSNAGPEIGTPPVKQPAPS